MKKLLLTSALFLSLVFTSCSNDDTPSVQPIPTHTEMIGCDTEDNLVKINDGTWLHNSNLDWNNWVYYQERGFQLMSEQFTVVTTNGNVITNAVLVNIDTNSYTVKYKDANSVLFKFKQPNLINAGDLVYVQLQVQNQ